MNKEKIGILFCSFNNSDTVVESLESWIKVKEYNPNLVYSCVSIPFLQYKDLNILEDNTIELVRATNIMDFHITEPKYLSEIEARGLALKFLKEQGCTIVWLVDTDEIFSTQDINNIVEYVNNHPQTAWFKISYKNYFQNKKTYIAEAFTPPRIFRVNYPPFQLEDFRDDNNVFYSYNNQKIWDECLPNKIIPASVANPRHYSWLNGEKSYFKYLYQIRHFGQCSYFCGPDGKVNFNEEYYRNNRQSLPKVCISS